MILRTPQHFIGIIAATGTAVSLLTVAPAQSTVPELTITTIDSPRSKVSASNGERGAALAVMADGRLLLGGGANGSSLFIYDPVKEKTILAGRAIKASERINDSRFAITDIGILSQSPARANLLISFPTFSKVPCY